MTSFAFARTHPLLRAVFAAVGMGPKRIGADLDGTTLRVRMGWWFRATIPIASITSATPTAGPVFGWGVHGFGGRWLVNTTGTGLVTLELSPRAPSRVLGLPIGLSWLRISLADPEAFLAALAR